MKIDFPTIRRRELWGAHAPARADFGAPAEISLMPKSIIIGKVCDHEGVIASTRGASAHQDI
jgi:hypothetical protein